MEGTAQVRSAAGAWSLAGDRQLLQLLAALHQKISSKCEEANEKLQHMNSALDGASVSLQNVNNRFMSLSASQFIESRVYEDDTDAPQPNTKTETKDAVDAGRGLSELARGLARLELHHEPVHILPDSDSDSDSDGDLHTHSVVFRPRDMYAHRPLPHVIGTRPWKEKWHAGLVAEDSDSESGAEGSAGGADPPDFSSDDSEPSDVTHKHTHQVWREDEGPGPAAAPDAAHAHQARTDLDRHRVRSQSEVAAEVARRLAGGAPPAPAPPPESPPPPAPAARAAAAAAIPALFRPQPPTRLTGAVFSDEPPPLDRDHEYGRDHDHDDIFAELDGGDDLFNSDMKQTGGGGVSEALFADEAADEEITQTKKVVRSVALDSHSPSPPHTPDGDRAPHSIRKPVGGISLFGDSTGAATIGDAILERGRAQPQKRQPSHYKKPPVQGREEEHPYSGDETTREEEDAFADLFAKAAAPTVAPAPSQKYNIKDDLFDDIDDLFSSNIVSTVQVKEPDETAPGLFDDDDDLFADLDFSTPKKMLADTNKKEIIKATDTKGSIFDDDSEDDLFSDKPVTTVADEETKSKEETSPEKATHPTTLFDDNDDSDGDLFSISSKVNFSKNDSTVIKTQNYAKTAQIRSVKESNSVLDTPKVNTEIHSNVINQIISDSPLLFDDDNGDDLFITTVVQKTVDNNKQSFSNDELVDKREQSNQDLSNVNNKAFTTNLEKLNEFGDENIFKAKDSAIKSVKPNILKDLKEFEAVPGADMNSNKLEEEDNSAVTVNSDSGSFVKDSHGGISPHENIQEKNEKNGHRENKVKIISANPERLEDALKADAHSENKFTSPLIFDDDDVDDLFRSKDISVQKSEEADNFKRHSKGNNDDLIITISEQKASVVQEVKEFNDNDDIFKTTEVYQNDAQTNLNLKSHIEAHAELIINNSDEKMSTCNKLDFNTMDINLKPELTPKPNLFAEQKNTSKIQGKLSSVANDDVLVRGQDIIEVPSNYEISTLDEQSRKMDDKSRYTVKNVPEDDDIFSETPSATKSDSFHDIFNDQPPEFSKPSEPKKSKNVNALFDDDSDDEALFFKRSDNLLEEKVPEVPTENKISFGLFSDEPPDLDFDFEQKLKISVENVIPISEDNVFGDPMQNSNKMGLDIEPPKTLPEIPTKKEIDKTIKDHITDVKTDNFSVDFKNTLGHKNVSIDSADGISQSKDTKAVGKLKSININIDVNSLKPGASPKKVGRTADIEKSVDIGSKANKESEVVVGNDTLSDSNPAITKSISFEDDSESSLLCNKLSKDRAKIQVKRRPSSRKARKEAARKSAIEFTEGYDSPDANGFLEEHIQNAVSNKGQIESNTENYEHKGDDKVGVKTLGRIYSDVRKDRDKGIFGEDSDDDLFGKGTRTGGDEKNAKSPTSKIGSIGKAADKPSKSILSDDDDDDLFKTVSKKPLKVLESKEADKVKRKSLFDDSSDEELFGAAPRATQGGRERPAQGAAKGSSASATAAASTDGEVTSRRAAVGGGGVRPALPALDDPLSALGDRSP